jgi:glutamine---fructose-6-phosphate transaminase (isomerizing)
MESPLSTLAAPTRMLEEALDAPRCVARLLEQDDAAYRALARHLRRRPRDALLTLARGSSDHAAQHLAYLVMARLSRLVTSLPMSLVTLYGARLPAGSLQSFAFSQSGQSPDLVEPTRALRAAGAGTVALVNDTASPLATAAEFVLPLHAGVERSIAATKSHIAQLVAGARLVAAWQPDAALAAAVAALPAALAAAAAQDWSAAVARLRAETQLFVIGRGPGLAVAQEAALKFKEACGMQAEAFSSAEVQHGPMALVGPGWPVLVLAPRGPTQAGLLPLALRLHERGAAVILALPEAQRSPFEARAEARGLLTLPLVATGHEDLDAIAAVQSFYPMVEALARARGRNPDQPPNLAKVTKTH